MRVQVRGNFPPQEWHDSVIDCIRLGTFSATLRSTTYGTSTTDYFDDIDWLYNMHVFELYYDASKRRIIGNDSRDHVRPIRIESYGQMMVLLYSGEIGAIRERYSRFNDLFLWLTGVRVP